MIQRLLQWVNRSQPTTPVINDEWQAEDLTSNRAELAQRWITGAGIEIGALHQPTSVAPGVTVRYVDYRTQTENQARYPELSDRKIAATDILDDGFILRKVSDDSQDFVIANHALEHSPDPYGTLLVWKQKLRRRGVLYFAVPVAEKCYDHGRPLTTLDHFLEDRRLFASADVAGILAVTEGHLRDFMSISDANIRREIQQREAMTQAEIEQACAVLLARLRSAFQAVRTPADLLTAHVVNLNKYYDIHYHTFSPTSLFEFTAHFCRRERCELLDVRKSGGGEAIAVLRKIG